MMNNLVSYYSRYLLYLLVYSYITNFYLFYNYIFSLLNLNNFWTIIFFIIHFLMADSFLRNTTTDWRKKEIGTTNNLKKFKKHSKTIININTFSHCKIQKRKIKFAKFIYKKLTTSFGQMTVTKQNKKKSILQNPM